MVKLLHCPGLESRLAEIMDEFVDEDHVDPSDWADSSCATDHETEAFDVFENGFELAVKACRADRDVQFASLDGTTYFFIGTEDEVQTVLDQRCDEARREVETFQIVNLCDEAAERGASSVQILIYSSHDHVADVAEFSFKDHESVADSIREWLDEQPLENKILKDLVALRDTGVFHGADEGCEELIRLRIG